MRAPGCRWRTMPSSARPCRLTRRHILQRPAEPRGGQAEGRGLRQAERLVRRNRAQQHVADAVVERIAARQHHDRPAAMLLDFRHRLADRAGPGEPAAADQRVGQAEMALAADHQLGSRRPASAPPATGRRRRPRRCRRWTAKARPCRLPAGSWPPACVFSSSAARRKPRRWPSVSPAMRASRRPCRSPAAPPRPSRSRSPTRVGGFGGADGLADFLRARRSTR